MEMMEANLTVFVTQQVGFNFSYPYINFQWFSQADLLDEYGFGQKVRTKISNWPSGRYTRMTDIVRVMLAHKYRLSYIDLDMCFVSMNRDWYMRPYVGAAIWQNEKNAIEMTNAAFCFPRHVLEDITRHQHQRIAYGSDKYFYTELGPAMFMKVLANHHYILMLSQNSPVERYS
jgi:hypothetical protein